MFSMVLRVSKNNYAKYFNIIFSLAWFFILDWKKNQVEKIPLWKIKITKNTKNNKLIFNSSPLKEMHHLKSLLGCWILVVCQSVGSYSYCLHSCRNKVIVDFPETTCNKYLEIISNLM